MKIHNVSSVLGVGVFIGLMNCATQVQAQSPVGAQAESATPPSVVARPPNRMRQDNAVTRDVRRALQRVSGLDHSRIHVQSWHGHVTLTGTVPDSWQISRAGNAARSVRGVTSVTNRLTARNRR